MPGDYNLQYAVSMSLLTTPWGWVPFGPPLVDSSGYQQREAAMKICPVCCCLVPNEDTLLGRHRDLHLAQEPMTRQDLIG